MRRQKVFGVLPLCVAGVACGLDRTGPAPIELPERPDDALQRAKDAGSADAVVIDADTGLPDTGKWYQANNADCVPFCKDKGLENVPSPEGAKCTSGENIPQSALDAKIEYEECWPDCSPHVGPNARSFGGDCYADGQSRDGDRSDETRGCFCR